MIDHNTIKEQLGLSDKEARVYYALLREGSGYASVIAVESGVKRSTAYQILDKLHSYGLVHKYIKGNKFYYTRSKPDNVLQFLKDRESMAKKRISQFEKMLPELQIYYSDREKKPKLEHYDKKKQVEDLLIKTLRVPESDGVFGFLSVESFIRHVGSGVLVKFVGEIALQELPVKLLNYDKSPRNAKKESRLWVKKHFGALPKNLQPKIKGIDSNQELSAFTLISGNSVFLIDITPPEYMGTVISNKDMVQGIRTVFDNLWRRL